MLFFSSFVLVARLLYQLLSIYVIAFAVACSWTGKRIEAACFGPVLLFCVCEDHLSMFWNTSSGFSSACCQWWTDAGIMVLEKFKGICQGRTGGEFLLSFGGFLIDRWKTSIVELVFVQTRRQGTRTTMMQMQISFPECYPCDMVSLCQFQLRVYGSSELHLTTIYFCNCLFFFFS